MAKKRPSGLGRGIDNIFIDNSIENDNRISTLAISEIDPRGSQPRKSFDGEALSQLADSIAAHGVLQPIIVRESADGRYEIIAGERRYRAAKLAGLSEMPVIVIDSDDAKTAQLALVENVQRENLNAFEEASAYRALADGYKMTQEQIADKIGKSRSAVANMMRLLDLPDEAAALLAEGKISAGHARALLALEDADDIVELAQRIAKEGISVRSAELAVKKINKQRAAELEAKAAKKKGKVAPVVDYVKDLERRSMELLGRKVKICNDSKAKHITISYENNEDLEALLIRLCGNTLIDG